MYNNTSAFQKPIVENSFTRTSRKIVEPVSIKVNCAKQMPNLCESNAIKKSIPNVSDRSQNQSFERELSFKREANVDLLSRNQAESSKVRLIQSPVEHESSPAFRGSEHRKRFSFSITEPLYEDSTIIWKCKLGNAQYGKQKRKITFKHAETIIVGWTNDNYPQTHSLSINQFPGYFDELECLTDVVLILDIAELNTVWEMDTPLHDIRYTNKREITWDIPKEMTELNFKLLVGGNSGNEVQLPLSSPLKLEFEIHEE